MSSFFELREFESRFQWMCKEMEITMKQGRFLYFLDLRYTDFNMNCGVLVKNMTPDYGILLQSGLMKLRYGIEENSNDFCNRYNSVIDSLLLLVDRIIAGIKEQKPLNWENQLKWFQNMKKEQAASFEEAIQRILFVNQMLWQSGSNNVGLGKLDSLLMPYYEKDKKLGIINSQEAEEILEDFVSCIHEYYRFKSNQLQGDTGQIIVIGGLDNKEHYYRNELTDLFLEVIKNKNWSDPKLILRVSKEMPKDLLEKAIQCLMKGNGSPLLSNDDVVIPRLLEFGVHEEDVYQYTTSACWEPLIGGKSSSMNNERSLSYIVALHNFLLEEKLERFKTFDDLFHEYMKYLQREIRVIKNRLWERSYQRNTLFSVFMSGCRESKKDIIDGGAKYHNVGITTVGFGNIVNALLNIKRYVFEDKRYSLVDVKKMAVFNYEEYENVIPLLKNNERQYGCDSEEIISLSNRILYAVSEYTKDFTTPIGGKLKFGVSSPNYIAHSTEIPASFDGRKLGEPFIVHISNENAASYTETMLYAAGLDYGENRFNGNVVDLMVSPSLAEQNFDKFVQVIWGGIIEGFFQLQMNVVSSDMLIKAKENPEEFPNLIVRVWGFSAYFVELPETYQNVLIERALRNEGKL